MSTPSLPPSPRSLEYYAVTRDPQTGQIQQVLVTVAPGQTSMQVATGVCYRTVTEAKTDLIRLNGGFSSVIATMRNAS